MLYSLLFMNFLYVAILIPSVTFFSSNLKKVGTTGILRVNGGLPACSNSEEWGFWLVRFFRCRQVRNGVKVLFESFGACFWWVSIFWPNEPAASPDHDGRRDYLRSRWWSIGERLLRPPIIVLLNSPQRTDYHCSQSAADKSTAKIG